MSTNPLAVFEKHDPELLSQLEASQNLAFKDGALSSKHKILIALALDASHGAVNGVKSLAFQARESGASDQEILEAVRVAGFVAGAGSVFTAAAGLSEVLKF